MTWNDDDSSSYGEPNRFSSRPGGDWQGIRPSLDNPMSWSIFMGCVAGIVVRVHISMLFYILVMLLISVKSYISAEQATPIGFWLTAIMMGSLFLIVLIHEFGHCLACRWSGGAANEILMWPLGGLAYCRPPHRWKAHFITVVGGPIVNVFFFIIVGLMLGLLTGRWLGVALPNPINPFAALHETEIMRSLAHQTLCLFHGVNLVLLMFNLLPIFPLDGGRLVQSLLWPRYGYGHSMRLAVRVGFIGAILLGLFGFVLSNMMIVLIAVFGGLTCYQTNRQLAFTEDFMGFEDDEYMLNRFEEDPDRSKATKPSKREQKQLLQKQKQQEEEAVEVDRILKKIAESGMDSLTRRERRLLKTVTRQKRKNP